MMKWAWTVLGAMVLLSISFVTASGADHIVDDDVGTWRTHATIQDAINDSAEGDTVYVYAGTYEENVIVNRTIDLVGNGSAETIVNGTDGDHAIHVTSAHCNISHLHVTGGTDSGFEVGEDWTNIHNCSVAFCDEGIRLAHYDNVVDNCTIEDSTYGIIVAYTQRQTVKWCGIGNTSRSGIRSFGGSYLELRNLSFWNSGLYIGGNSELNYDSHGIWDCEANGRPIVYLSNAADQVFSSEAGQLIIGDCYNITVRNRDFDNVTYGIVAGYSNRVHVVTCTFEDVYMAVHAKQLRNSGFDDVRIDRVGDNGLYLDDSHRITISRVDATGQGDDRPIYVSSSCWNVTIADCNSTDFWGGIVSAGDGVCVENCTLRDNDYGLYLYGTNTSVRNCDVVDNYAGMYIVDGEWTNVTNCSFHGGTTYGIRLDFADNNTIAYNEFFDNDWYGVQADSDSRDNVIHHNNFANTSGSSSQATDAGTDNAWDDGSEGNYWSDWGGSGNYSIDGGAGSEDHHPLGGPVNTSAPEKVREPHLLVTITALLVIMAILRRRRVEDDL